nr:hypothetical protein SHINE37_44479 [Rhizobiaceae bacterium]
MSWIVADMMFLLLRAVPPAPKGPPTIRCTQDEAFGKRHQGSSVTYIDVNVNNPPAACRSIFRERAIAPVCDLSARPAKKTTYMFNILGIHLI